MIDKLAEVHPLLPPILGLILLLIFAVVVDLIVKRIVISIVRAIAKRSRTSWDDELVKHNVVGRLVQVAPAAIVYTGVGFLPGAGEDLVVLTRNIAVGYMILVMTLAITALLSAVHAIYSTSPAAKARPLKGFVQLMQIAVWIIAALMIVATILDRSPLLLLSGLGAMTAILLLIFKDTILSFVASVQLAAQDMVRVGDWIEVPQFGADGDVIDVQLHTISVQNWDKTITTIPTHRLISDSFKNWRGMSESGGRRIKRSILFDLSSIRFLTDEEVDRFKRFKLLKDYVVDKTKELADYNASLESDVNVNQRRMTNIGTFRAYALNYLRNHPRINEGMTLLVRQLEPGAEGLPMQIYCFTNTTAWAEYEGIQGDVFD
ncbi:MAG: mechanosensitive ion channel, partial [Woeseiaceae bacterium]|nr:mechanosensitive ion channel [Woeseiaceae bacterium]